MSTLTAAESSALAGTVDRMIRQGGTQVMGTRIYFGRRARIDDPDVPQPRMGTVVRNDDEVSVLIRWDNDATTAGLSWHKVTKVVGEVIVVAPEATPTMHQVAQASKQAALPPLIGGLPA